MKIAVADCLTLLHGAENAALATHSQALAGYPFVTSVPFALDAAHCPWLLMSDLAEHCRNARADGRVSLLLQQESDEVLAASRMTLLGDLQAAEPDAATQARLLRYCPAFGDYLALGDFHFFRLQPRRVRFIGGFGRMGWVEQGDWQTLPVLSAADEAALLASLAPPAEVALLGVDCFGLDLAQAGRRLRLPFALPGAGSELAAAARQALDGFAAAV
ncbi:HugZ family protein [Vogesella sp. LIG4]|uniref:HugZ family pyridoxamine 5'-phosphate oxidase n=1 Tax=Vogesella sp. LIG4 TaxID=1192162 RepID=UPI00081FC282|nr:pyridoxamine 5'-phosphate oxidase family protein [Vogesella sp. LIG4]SCK21667.1 hypothetical protein PSELUDRAFT_2479 [Vogesella sp. LIG4]